MHCYTRHDAQQVGFKEGDCPRGNLDIEFPVDWVCRNEGESLLQGCKLRVQDVHLLFLVLVRYGWGGMKDCPWKDT